MRKQERVESINSIEKYIHGSAGCLYSIHPCENILMQKDLTAASRIGEDRIREAFEYAASGMAITDLDGRFQEANPAYRGIVGRSQDELDAESILSITHEEDRQNCRHNLARLLAGEVSSFVLENR
jgi:PAS domain-containing protein